MNALTVFGSIAVTLMLIFYALENRSRWYTLAFAGACAFGSAYGFLQGPGHLESSRAYGLSWQSGAGGWLPNRERKRHSPLAAASIE